MKIQISSRSFVLTEALRAYIERRSGFALSWASSHIRSVQVRLSDINGDRGGIDKRCMLVIGIIGGTDIVVGETQADMYSAVDRAMDRAARTLTRVIHRDRFCSSAVTVSGEFGSRPDSSSTSV